MANPVRARADSSVVRCCAQVRAGVIAVSSIALVAALSACGDSSAHSNATSTAPASTASASTSSATTTATSTGPTEAQKAADQTTAKNSTLKLSDFPSGWVQSDKSSPGAKCPSVEAAKKATSGRASPPDFTMGQNDQVTSAVYVYRTVTEAERVFPGLSGSETRTCIANAAEKAAKQSATEGKKFGAASTGQLSAPPLGDESTAGRVTIPFTVGSLSFTLNSDQHFVRVGRGIQILTFSTAPGTFDPGLAAKLTRTATDRLKAQLAQTP